MHLPDDAIWNDTRYKKPILLVAYTLLESLDELSHDSYQIPTLNIHTFCYDFLHTLRDVDKGILQQGNMVPLIEEFEFYCSHDYITKKIIGDDLCLSLRKTSTGSFAGNLSKLDDVAKIKIYRQQINLILNKISAQKDWFVNLLFDELEKLVFSSNYNGDSRNLIYYLSRTLCVELLSSYHRVYITAEVEKYFFNKRKIHNSRKNWNLFKKDFFKDEQKYLVTIGTNKELYNILSATLNGENREATQREKNVFNLPYVHVYKVAARDPFTACEFMRSFCDSITSVIKCEQHDVSFKLSKRVKCKTEKQTHSHWLFEDKDFIKKRRNKPDSVAQKTYQFFLEDRINRKMLKILDLHATAIGGAEPTNQLLNLWTILETVVDVDKNSGIGKCTQICNSITSILNDNYLYSLLIYFYCDIKNCGIDISSLLSKIKKGETKIEKFLRLLSESKYLPDLQNTLAPNELLLMRLERLTAIFTANTTENAYDLLSAHSNRLRWHIMRIYRNRNLIIHEGENTRYLSAIVDNLHFYVDMTLDFIWQKFFDGFRNISHILDYATSLEARRLKEIGCEFDQNGNLVGKKFTQPSPELWVSVVIKNSFNREMEI